MNKINALLLAVIASALIVATAYGGIATTTSTTPQGGEGVQFDRQGGVVPDYNHFEGVTPLTITRVAIVGTYADGHQVTIFTGNFYNGSPELRLTNLTLTMTDQGHGFQPRRR